MKQLAILVAFFATLIAGVTLGCLAMRLHSLTGIIAAGWTLIAAIALGLRSGILRRLIERLYLLD